MSVLFQQLISMGLLVALGYYLGRRGMLRAQTSQDLSTLLMQIVLPCMIFTSFDRPFRANEALELGYVFLVCLGCMILNIVVAGLCFPSTDGIERYAAVFNNKGFMGIPVVTALFGAEAVFYATPSIIITNLFVCTYGAAILGRSRDFRLKNVLLNPSTLAFLLGLLYYLLPFRFPEWITRSLRMLNGINTPLAMLLLGYFLSSESLQGVFLNRKAWKVAFVRLILLPLLTVVGLYFLPGSTEFKYVMTVVWAAPTALNLSMQACIIGRETGYAAQVTSLTTILSLVTMPLLLQVAQWVIGS